jgi:hypothetical protein
MLFGWLLVMVGDVAVGVDPDAECQESGESGFGEVRDKFTGFRAGQWINRS